ncbi:hypothetical protein ACFWFZ_03175 [Streptomyces sp. NPDC060232]|uniref:hypothetical protein n=1 Tax=Streptomyces sp. NPDC060232 TaxID=3347079 RepID=UPI003646D986
MLKPVPRDVPEPRRDLELHPRITELYRGDPAGTAPTATRESARPQTSAWIWLGAAAAAGTAGRRRGVEL